MPASGRRGWQAVRDGAEDATGAAAVGAADRPPEGERRAPAADDGLDHRAGFLRRRSK